MMGDSVLSGGNTVAGAGFCSRGRGAGTVPGEGDFLRTLRPAPSHYERTCRWPSRKPSLLVPIVRSLGSFPLRANPLWRGWSPRPAIPMELIKLASAQQITIKGTNYQSGEACSGKRLSIPGL